MINLTYRELSAGDFQNCSSTPSATPPQYRIIIDKTAAQLNADAAAGWKLFWVIEQDSDQVKKGVQKTDDYPILSCAGGSGEKFAIVGQANGTTSTTEFLISKSWTYGEIIQTTLLFLMCALGIFIMLFNFFRKKRKNL